MKDLFLLDPDVTFLNHGSFGACPRSVFEVYQRRQLEIERAPVDFFIRQAYGLLREARAALAAYLQTSPDNLIFVTNATTGLNVVAHSLKLAPGDEVLTTDHEYGAMDRMWEMVCARSKARYVHCAIPMPPSSEEAVVDRLWNAVTPRTRVVFMSHITSPTALILPVEEMCRRARAAGILTVIDGAHAPGQIPLNLDALGADFYAGNCHKWMCAPKGAGFLCARGAARDVLEPLVISWETDDTAALARRMQWGGTRDLAAFLSVRDAIAFQEAHGWDDVRARCHVLAAEAMERLAMWSGMAPATPHWFAQMASAPLPPCDAAALGARLYQDWRVEVPVVAWKNQIFVRVSMQGYNTRADIDRLCTALTEVCG